MAINLDDSLFVGQQKADSAKYDNDGKGYTDVANAMSVLPNTVRYAGLTINVAGIEYWWPSNDSDLTKDPIVKEQGGGASSFSELEGDPYDNVALAEDLNRIEGKADVAQEDIDLHEGRTDNPHSVTKTQVGLGNVPNTDATNPANITQSASYRFATDTEKATWNGKLAGTLAADADLQTQTTPTEDNKIVSRHGLIYYFNWLKTQVVNITGRWQFAGIGAGIASNVASFLNLAVNTASVGQILLPKSAVDYTGTLAGMLWNNAMEFKFYDDVVGSVNRLIKLNGNSALANSNPLNVVTSTGTGGNLGTLKAEVAFSRFPVTSDYTVSLNDIGFGWIIGVTDVTSPRTITLPLANSVPAGWRFSIKDETDTPISGNVLIDTSGSDTCDNSQLGYAASITLYSDGVSKWFYVS